MIDHLGKEQDQKYYVIKVDDYMYQGNEGIRSGTSIDNIPTRDIVKEGWQSRIDQKHLNTVYRGEGVTDRAVQFSIVLFSYISNKLNEKLYAFG